MSGPAPRGARTGGRARYRRREYYITGFGTVRRTSAPGDGGLRQGGLTETLIGPWIGSWPRGLSRRTRGRASKELWRGDFVRLLTQPYALRDYPGVRRLRRVDAHHSSSRMAAARDTHRTGPLGNTIAALIHMNAMKA